MNYLVVVALLLVLGGCGKEGAPALSVPALAGTTWGEADSGDAWLFRADGALCIAAVCGLRWEQSGAALTLLTPERLACSLSYADPRLTLSCPDRSATRLDRR